MLKKDVLKKEGAFQNDPNQGEGAPADGLEKKGADAFWVKKGENGLLANVLNCGKLPGHPKAYEPVASLLLPG